MIPGQIISILTFPGVIVHELAHQLFCRWSRVAVYEVCYFRFGNPAGFVVHEPPASERAHLLIAIGPLFVNTVLGALIGAPAVVPVDFEAGNPLHYFLVWLGGSIAMHAFPSTGDAKSLWEAIFKRGKSLPMKILVLPVTGFIYLGALGSVIWLDVIYAALVLYSIPKLVFSILA